MRLLRVLAVVIAAACGTIVLLDYFISTPLLDAAGRTLVNWVTILAAAAFVLGFLNLLRVHGGRIIAGQSNWPYSAALIGAMLATMLLGFTAGSSGARDPALSWMFNYVYLPLGAAVFSLLAFYVATAAYRTLRLQTWEGAVMTIVGVIVLLGQIPLGARVSGAVPAARTWLLTVIGTAGLRGIVIAAALGATLAGLRLLLGIDRQYLDRDK